MGRLERIKVANNDKTKAARALVGHQEFYGKGKLLLTGEYFVLDGALSLALPTSKGQRLNITYRRSFTPKLFWKAMDFDGKVWFESSFEFWNFDCLDEVPAAAVPLLQKILRQARKQNVHFLRDNVDDVIVETHLEFPLSWGLGSSSTLVYNIAQWAYISPFELQFKSIGGSGYDIACAQSDGPILYERVDKLPKWESSTFNPSFKDNLYFVYLGRKQSSVEGIDLYRSRVRNHHELILKLSNITREFISAQNLEELEFLIEGHEKIISNALDIPRAQDIYFKDYWGSTKSLGAWGGDFLLVTSSKSREETENYFRSRGFNDIVPYRQMIYNPIQKLPTNEYLQ